MKKPSRQIRPPKGKGSVSSKVLKEAVKKVAEKRQDSLKEKSQSKTPIHKKK